ncbi:hypothetical protein BDZ89DRAFT_1054137 [Hymenopellis radicata]|nr:hypothetical protein BDZ89DRAFT_1054137 [Hymenopellis radicata]
MLLARTLTILLPIFFAATRRTASPVHGWRQDAGQASTVIFLSASPTGTSGMVGWVARGVTERKALVLWLCILHRHCQLRHRRSIFAFLLDVSKRQPESSRRKPDVTLDELENEMRRMSTLSKTSLNTSLAPMTSNTTLLVPNSSSATLSRHHPTKATVTSMVASHNQTMARGRQLSFADCFCVHGLASVAGPSTAENQRKAANRVSVGQITGGCGWLGWEGEKEHERLEDAPKRGKTRIVLKVVRILFESRYLNDSVPYINLAFVGAWSRQLVGCSIRREVLLFTLVTHWFIHRMALLVSHRLLRIAESMCLWIQATHIPVNSNDEWKRTGLKNRQALATATTAVKDTRSRGAVWVYAASDDAFELEGRSWRPKLRSQGAFNSQAYGRNGIVHHGAGWTRHPGRWTRHPGNGRGTQDDWTRFTGRRTWFTEAGGARDERHGGTNGRRSGVQTKEADPLFKQSVLFALLTDEAHAVKTNDFNTCNKSGFCRRSPYSADSSSISISPEHAAATALVKSSLCPDINFELDVMDEKDCGSGTKFQQSILATQQSKAKAFIHVGFAYTFALEQLPESCLLWLSWDTWWPQRLTYPSTATSDNYRGTVLFNPGGPGESGVTALQSVSPLFAQVIGSQYDIVSFDPRVVSVNKAQGVGVTLPHTEFFPTETERVLWLADPTKFSHVINETHDVASQDDRVERLVIDDILDLEAYYSGDWRHQIEDADAALQTCFDGRVAAGPTLCAFYADAASDSSQPRVSLRLRPRVTRAHLR